MNIDEFVDDSLQGMRYADNPALSVVWSVLNRGLNVDALLELYKAIDPGERRPDVSNCDSIAFGFDTNAMYRLGLNGTRGADSIDYLRTQHSGPVVLPGQAIQELWNNLLAGVEPQAKQLRKRFDDLKESVEAIGQRLGEPGEAAVAAIDALLAAHGEWVDPASMGTFGGTLEALLAVANCHFVPRADFYELARVRHETKTPPGFRDPATNHGDFYLWADFLYGVANCDMTSVEAVVLVTNDVKSDWSRHGVPHPILTAEARAVGHVPFDLWTLSKFQGYVSRANTSPEEPGTRMLSTVGDSDEEV